MIKLNEVAVSVLYPSFAKIVIVSFPTSIGHYPMILKNSDLNNNQLGS
jgi:hypothetical protein